MSTLATSEAACAHCGAGVPEGLIDADAPEQFCCGGCKAARSLISSCGLGSYYSIVSSAGVGASRPEAASVDRAYAEFDDGSFQSAHSVTLPDGTRRMSLSLSGIHCAGCLWLIEKLPRMVPGVIEARVSIRHGEVSVLWDPRQVSLSTVAGTLGRLGYAPRPVREQSARERARTQDRASLIKIAAAGALAGNVMMIAFALYGGYFHGMASELRLALRWLSCGLGVACLAWPGAGFFVAAWRALVSRTPSIDVPIVLALLAGGLAGLINTVLDRGELYFDSLTMLVTLLLAGRFIGERQQRWAADAVSLLYTLTPFAARRRGVDGNWHDTPAESLQIGDVILAKAGESIAVDGVVALGTSSVDTGLLTGESAPKPVSVGSQVFAGSVNTAAPLEIRATATGRDTRAASLMRTVEDAATRRAPIIRFADSIAGWFVIVVPVAALLTYALWFGIDPAQAVDNAMAVLIVTCPCVLGIAAPVAVALAIGKAGKDGVLIKGGDVLERLAHPGIALLDKTGTLTEGAWRIAASFGEDRAITLAAAIERDVAHPVAAAFITEASGPVPEAQNIRHVMGRGVEGWVGGLRIAVGSPEFIRGSCEPSVQCDEWLAEIAALGASPVCVSEGRRVIGAVAMRDRPRQGTREALDRLRRAGWDLRVLSGDDTVIAKRVGAELGLDPDHCEGHLAPEEKLARVRQLKSEHPTRTILMVGDGVNDSAALAAADVGVAVHGGAEASLAAADVHFSTPGLVRLADLVEAGPRMVVTIQRMFMVSLAYNVLAGGLAVGGLIHPMLAAALMPISSLSTLAVAMRARVWRASELSVSRKKCCGKGGCGSKSAGASSIGPRACCSGKGKSCR